MGHGPLCMQIIVDWKCFFANLNFCVHIPAFPKHFESCQHFYWHLSNKILRVDWRFWRRSTICNAGTPRSRLLRHRGELRFQLVPLLRHSNLFMTFGTVSLILFVGVTSFCTMQGRNNSKNFSTEWSFGNYVFVFGPSCPSVQNYFKSQTCWG